MQINLKEIYVEQPSSVVFPDETKVIPGQDTSISELLDRFTRGQRLNVKMRSQNPQVEDFDVFDENGNHVGVKLADDDVLFQPIIDNPDELEDYLEEQRETLRQTRGRKLQTPEEKSAEAENKTVETTDE